MTIATDAAERTRVLQRAVHSALGRSTADIAGSFFVPGRIEVLGKHTDYAGGRSLLAAVNRGFVVAAVPRSDNAVRVIDSATGEVLKYDSHEGVRNDPPAWATYPLAVLRRCERNFPRADGGADIAFASDLPQAAGLSSSSALVVATFLALDAVRQMSGTAEYVQAIAGREDLAGYLGAVENGLSFRTLEADAGVGTMGGSEDHTAILCARPGRLVQYSYSPVRFEADIPLPAGWVFAIASSGVRAEKTGAALTRYNELSASTRRLVRLWQAAGAGSEDTLGAIVGEHPDAALRMREIISRAASAEADVLLMRLAQFLAESEDIVPGAAAALGRGDLAGFADFVSRSQGYAERALCNQIPETMHLVESACAAHAAAASAFGAGFGGSVWALVREEVAGEFVTAWRASYVSRFPQWNDSSEFFISAAASPAVRLGTEVP